MRVSASERLEGTVVSVDGDKLTTTCNEGREHCQSVSKDARVTRDGKPSSLSDLKVGDTVFITTRKDDRTVATAVESGQSNPAIPSEK
jgi:hypothetical protein